MTAKVVGPSDPTSAKKREAFLRVLEQKIKKRKAACAARPALVARKSPGKVEKRPSPVKAKTPVKVIVPRDPNAMVTRSGTVISRSYTSPAKEPSSPPPLTINPKPRALEADGKIQGDYCGPTLPSPGSSDSAELNSVQRAQLRNMYKATVVYNGGAYSAAYYEQTVLEDAMEAELNDPRRPKTAAEEEHERLSEELVDIAPECQCGGKYSAYGKSALDCIL